MNSFARRIRPHVHAELAAAEACDGNQDIVVSFRHLERAHVLGQASTLEHVRVHAYMLLWAVRHRKPREIAGQLIRIVGAATLTAAGFVPVGNTGGANVSPWRRMDVPSDLADVIAGALPRSADV